MEKAFEEEEDKYKALFGGQIILAKSIGATLSLKNGNFFTNIKSAINASNNLKSSLGGSTSGMKGLGSQSTSAGNILTSLASKLFHNLFTDSGAFDFTRH